MLVVTRDCGFRRKWLTKATKRKLLHDRMQTSGMGRRLRQTKRPEADRTLSSARLLIVCALLLYPTTHDDVRFASARTSPENAQQLRAAQSPRRRLQEGSTWNSQQLQFEYDLFGPWDLVNSTVTQLRRQSIQAIREEFLFETPRSGTNRSWVQISNADAQTVVQKCNDAMDSSSGDCNQIVTTLTAKVDSHLDPLLVEQAALSRVRSFLTNYNSQQTSVFVEYIFPMYVTTVVRLTAVGLTSVMNPKRQDLFMGVFQKGFKVLMSSSNTDPPLTLLDAKVLYQVAPTSTSRQNETRRLASDVGSTTAEESLLVSLSVEAMCGTQACTPQYLQDFVMHEGDRFGSAWVQGIQQQAQTATRTSALASYFAPLTQIVFSTTVLDENLPPSRSIYQPDDVQSENPIWLWIALGVDGVVWLLAVIWILLQLRRRRRYNARGSNSKQSPSQLEEQYPTSSDNPNEGVRRGRGPTKDSWKDEPSESTGESERIFDDGIRVREVVAEDTGISPESTSEQDASSASAPRVHDDGIRVREASMTGDSQAPGYDPTPDATFSSSSSARQFYDDGYRISTEERGRTSRIHDDGIHISNSIQDID